MHVFRTQRVNSLGYIYTRSDFEFGNYWYRIRFIVWTQMSESKIRTTRFDQVSGDFESQI